MNSLPARIAARAGAWTHAARRLRRRLRTTLGVQILLALCAVACVSTSLALVIQDRSLSVDLQAAARVRLEGAAAAAEQLIDGHLAALAERYRAITGTPQFLANVESGHTPTLAYFAAQLRERHGARSVMFLDQNGGVLARTGDPMLAAEALRAAGRGGLRTALFGLQSVPHAVAGLPLVVDGQPVGRLVVVEQISTQKLAAWSQLCGARVTIDDGAGRDDLSLAVRPAGELRIRVTAALDAERAALAHSRRSLIAAGLTAMVLALAVGFVVTRSLARPIQAIRAGAERIAQGDLSFRLDETRSDEVGDVARAFNMMLDSLDKTQGRLINAQRLARLGNWRFDRSTGELDGSPEFRRIYGFDDPTCAPTLDALASRVHPDDRREFLRAFDECLANGTTLHLDHRAVTADGVLQIVHTYAERVDEQSLEGTVQDITDRKQVEDQIRYLAYHDSLTGLGNRRLLKERLGLALEQSRRAASSVAVMFLDVDRFKDVNDTLGHTAGDELLLGVADRLIDCVQVRGDFGPPADSVADVGAAGGAEHTTLVARLGGDEFTVLLTDVRDRQEIEVLARRILDSFADSFELKGQEVRVTASIGIALSPDDAKDVESLLRNSDTAMYHAKRTRSSFQFFTDSMRQAAFHRLLMENKLRRAIENQDFELYYQPKVELKSHRIVGVEALLRWRDPELGIVGPSEFIPMAEEIGMVSPLGEWVLRTAMEQAIAWRRDGLPPLRIAVNISVHQMEDGPEFVRTISSLLAETGLEPNWLDLEITESTLMNDEAAGIALLQQLRDMGIGLSLDDFGTGYSSLSYLRRLPIDTLKIDQSFVRWVDTDPDDAALAGAIIGMAKVLGLRVVVEGVETDEQRVFLEALGCDEVQGFLFSTPVRAEEVTEMLRLQSSGREAAGAGQPRPGPALA